MSHLTRLDARLGMLLPATLLAALTACSGGTATPSADQGLPDTLAPDALAPDTVSQPDLMLPPDLGVADLLPPPDSAPPPPPLIEARGLIHMHSIYSHDACDGKGFEGGKPNTQCLNELRDAVCAAGFHFLALTDHPANMRDYPMADTLLFNAAKGDQLVTASHGGDPIANRLACPGGHRVLVTVGFEATHMMPVGLQNKPTDKALYGGVTDATDPAALKAQVKGLRDLGAVVSMVHSEEDDISAKTIDDAGFEMMEWYNIHASFKALLGDDLLSADLQNIIQLTELVGTLQELAPFLNGGAGAPHPDLVYLLLLEELPPGGFDKWRAIQRGRPITGILGSDIHRNVSVDASMCDGITGQLACNAALAVAESTLGISLAPVIKNVLLSGGTIGMPDGDRMDSYARLMRWLENRVLVEAVEPQALAEALRAGRTYGVFTIFGDPQGFTFRGAAGAQALQIGDGVATGPVQLQVALPQHPVPTGVPFTAGAAATAQLRAKIVHTSGGGSAVIHEETKLGALVGKQVSQPGAYHVEIWIRPLHLQTALGPAKDLANKEYLWVITNPIRIGPTP